MDPVSLPNSYTHAVIADQPGGTDLPPESQTVRHSGGDGGAGGTRTPDPLNAIEVLSQLSYSPDVSSLNADPSPSALKSTGLTKS